MIVDVVIDRKLTGASIAVSRAFGLDEPTAVEFADRTVSVDRFLERKSSARHASTKASSRPVLAVSPLVARNLWLPVGIPICVKVQQGAWRFGPCLALYAERGKKDGRRFGEQTKLFQDMSKLAHNYGVDLVVIEPGFLQSKTGWRYDFIQQRWRSSVIPIPDIVLRRSGSFVGARLQEARVELDWFSKMNRLHSLPATCTNKYQFYRMLNSMPELKSLAPKSTLARSADDVWKTIQRRRDVYVKPLSGAQGVMVVHLVAKGKRVTASWNARRPKGSRLSSGKAAGTRIESASFCNRKEFQRFWRRTGLTTCLVQDTIPLPTTKSGQPFDLRWLIQCVDEPLVLARVARIGPPGAVTTNIHTGGRAVDAAHAISEQFSASETDRLIRLLDRTALTIAEELQARYGRFAEVGIDMAVQEDGRPVVFEVNPTPGRRMLRELSSDLRELSLTYLLEYAVRATGFTGKAH